MALTQTLVYPVLIFLLGVFLLLTMPRAAIRFLLPYGVVYGGLLSFIYGIIFGDLLGFFWFENLGMFVASGHPLLPALAWTFIMMLFLYFWPKHSRQLGYLYTFAWILLATGFSQIVHYTRLYDYKPWFYPFPMFLTFAAKFTFVTWLTKPWDMD